MGARRHPPGDAKQQPSLRHAVREFLNRAHRGSHGGHARRGKRIGEYETDADEFEWRVLFVAGMWFQDLFYYDFRRTEMCIIPYGTQEGEISFCAYNTGIGWRNIIEHMHQNATVAKWYEEHGRHEIFAGGKTVSLADPTHGLKLNEVDLARPNKPHMEGPKTAHEETVMMRKLYQEMVLKQQEIKSDNGDKPVQIQGLSRKKELAVVSA